MGSLHRISDSLDYKFDRIFRISEFLLPFLSVLSQVYIFLYIHVGIYLHIHIGSSLAGDVVVVKIREKFGDDTRKLPIQELVYSYVL